MKPYLLLSNDDGISSPFLPIFARALAKVADVDIVVPANEQSWIGRAYSRHSELVVKEADFMGARCLTVSGTPSDCVNIALSHFVKNPDAVISGLNIGQNVGFPLLWSSGTFAAAVEAAGWGFAAFAFSMRLEKQFYQQCRIRHEAATGLIPHLEAASEHAAELVLKTLSQKTIPAASVMNVNYPIKYTHDTPFEKCVPARAKLSSLYVKNNRGGFDFSYAIGETSSPNGEITDLECLDALKACYSLISI